MTSRKRKTAAAKHATRGWKCACGRVVFGNGGRSSHQRACVVWKQACLARTEKAIAEAEAMAYGFLQEALPAMRRDVARLRGELNATPSTTASTAAPSSTEGASK